MYLVGRKTRTVVYLLGTIHAMHKPTRIMNMYLLGTNVGYPVPSRHETAKSRTIAFQA